MSAPDTTPSPETANTETETGTPADQRLAGMQSALQAERKQRQALAAQLKEFQDAKAAADTAARVANGEAAAVLKTTTAELTAAREQLAALQAAETARQDKLTASNTARVKKLPAAWRALVPAGLSADDTADQIAKIETMVTTATGAPVGTISRAPDKNEEPIPEACKAEAAKYGRDPRKHYNTVWKKRIERQKRRR